MTSPIQNADLVVASAACSIDEPCNTRCCDDHPAAAPDRPHRPGWKAAVFGALCLAGCLAGPLLAGGFAASVGAVSGEVVIGVVVAIIIVGFSIARRRGRQVC